MTILSIRGSNIERTGNQRKQTTGSKRRVCLFQDREHDEQSVRMDYNYEKCDGQNDDRRVANFEKICIWPSDVRENDINHNNIVEDILQNHCFHLTHEREEEIVESFTSVPKPGGRVKYIRNTQRLPGPERNTTRAGTYIKKIKWKTPCITKVIITRSQYSARQQIPSWQSISTNSKKNHFVWTIFFVNWWSCRLRQRTQDLRHMNRLNWTNSKNGNTNIC